MATIALRAATVDGNGQPVVGGHCYIIFSEARIHVKDLIREKILSEIRKARFGGPSTTSLDMLTGHGTPLFWGPLDDNLMVYQAICRFKEGAWELIIDGAPFTDLNDEIVLTRRTSIIFLVSQQKEMDVAR